MNNVTWLKQNVSRKEKAFLNQRLEQAGNGQEQVSLDCQFLASIYSGEISMTSVEALILSWPRNFSFLISWIARSASSSVSLP